MMLVGHGDRLLSARRGREIFVTADAQVEGESCVALEESQWVLVGFEDSGN
jgi:hypothetical protein